MNHKSASTLMFQKNASALASSSTAVSELKFPAMPQTLTEVMSLRAQGTPDVERLVEIVKKDPGVTAGVLRRVNSAYYGLGRKVAQAEKAVHLLGYREVYSLLLAAVIKQAFAFRATPDVEAVYHHILRNSIATASFARTLAEQLSPMLLETSFTAGLLHQLGRMVLLSGLPKAYVELWLRISPTRDARALVLPSVAMEQFLFNTDHIEIGDTLGRRWGLPEEIVTVIRNYEEPHRVSGGFLKTLTLIVAIGHAQAVRLYEPGDDQEAVIGELFEELARIRMIDIPALTDLLDSKQEDVVRYAESMVVD